MQLTEVDRWVLMNQYRILARLDPEGLEGDHEKAVTVLEHGYESEYGDLVPWLSEEPMSQEEGRRVLDILDMHRDLLWSYEDLEDKSGIERSEVAFLGFDGNNETRALGYARFLIDSGRWTELADSADGLNSHMPTMDMYGRMLPVWRRARENRLRSPAMGRERMSADEIRAICAERVHPTSR
jgi:hypothetical protein